MFSRDGYCTCMQELAGHGAAESQTGWLPGVASSHRSQATKLPSTKACPDYHQLLPCLLNPCPVVPFMFSRSPLSLPQLRS